MRAALVMAITGFVKPVPGSSGGEHTCWAYKGMYYEIRLLFIMYSNTVRYNMIQYSMVQCHGIV